MVSASSPRHHLPPARLYLPPLFVCSVSDFRETGARGWRVAAVTLGADRARPRYGEIGRHSTALATDSMAGPDSRGPWPVRFLYTDTPRLLERNSIDRTAPQSAGIVVPTEIGETARLY